MPKPTRQPNKLHQQILGSLVDTRPASWEHKKIDPEDPKKVVTTKVTSALLKSALAQNVSEQSVEQAAKRWIK